MNSLSWREQAEALFFIDHLSINDITAVVRKSRVTVSKHLNGCKEYEAEMEFRKQRSREKRKEYQRNWDKENRTYTEVTGESLKREHEIAVRILSADRF